MYKENSLMTQKSYWILNNEKCKCPHCGIFYTEFSLSSLINQSRQLHIHRRNIGLGSYFENWLSCSGCDEKIVVNLCYEKETNEKFIFIVSEHEHKKFIMEDV